MLYQTVNNRVGIKNASLGDLVPDDGLNSFFHVMIRIRG